MANDAYDNAKTDKEAYAKYAQRPASDDALAQLSQLAEDQLAAQTAVKDAEEALKQRQKELRDIAEVQVPELMDSLGMKEFETTSGIKIKVDKKYRASIKADMTDQAMRWLRDNGHEALIKRELKMTFGMGEDGLAQEAIDRLGDTPFDDKSKVENPTLVKMVREALEAGKEVPEELFNVFPQRFTKVTTKKR